jgi:hypothetical protein
MLRILIVATLLFLASATSVQADSSVVPAEGATIQLQIGARAGAQAVLQPAVRASVPTAVMQQTINGVARAQRAPDGRSPMLGLFGTRGQKPGLALPVSDSVSLGLRYQYLRREDFRRVVAESVSLDDGYSSHNVVLRARWHF